MGTTTFPLAVVDPQDGGCTPSSHLRGAHALLEVLKEVTPMLFSNMVVSEESMSTQRLAAAILIQQDLLKDISLRCHDDFIL